MNLDHPCTKGEAGAFQRAIVRFWPQPALGEGGQEMLTEALHATRHPADLLEAAIRQLQQTHPSHNRPTIPEINAVARGILNGLAATAPRPRPDLGHRVLSAPEMLGKLANVTMVAAEARSAYEARTGRRLAAVESGSMRHISTLLGIGPFRITGAMPAAQDLANGFLDRSDELEARR